MDPLSIVVCCGSVAATCYKITETLRQRIDECRRVDNNIRAAYNEIQSLSRILRAIKSTVQHSAVSEAVKDVQAEGDSTLWTSLHFALQDCGKAIRRFESLLPGFANNGTKLGSAWRNVKMKGTGSEISLIRHQIQTYINVLQMSLQMLTVYVPPPKLICRLTDLP